MTQTQATSETLEEREMDTLNKTLVRIDEIKREAIAHCGITRRNARQYANQLHACWLACDHPIARQAIEAAERRIVEIHGTVAEEILG